MGETFNKVHKMISEPVERRGMPATGHFVRVAQEGCVEICKAPVLSSEKQPFSSDALGKGVDFAGFCTLATGRHQDGALWTHCCRDAG